MKIFSKLSKFEKKKTYMVKNWTPYGFNSAQYFYLDLYAGQDVSFIRGLVKDFCSAKVSHYSIDTFSDVKKMKKFTSYDVLSFTLKKKKKVPRMSETLKRWHKKSFIHINVANIKLNVN